MDLSSGAVVLTTASGLLATALLVASEWKRAESDRALAIAMKRIHELDALRAEVAGLRARAVKAELKLAATERALRDADDCIAQFDAEIDRLERSVEHEREIARMNWAYTKALREFMVAKCLVQRPTKGRRWFSRIHSVRLKGAVLCWLKHDPRFETSEHELWGPEIDF